MPYPDFPESLASAITGISETKLSSRKRVIRFDAGPPKVVNAASGIDGFRAFANLSEEQYEVLLALHGPHKIRLSSGETRVVSLMGENPRFPGLAPFVHTQTMRTGFSMRLAVKFHLIDQGPA
ncbi:MAG: hypothetical protein ABGX15_02000 [Paracoccaceae bacterium]